MNHYTQMKEQNIRRFWKIEKNRPIIINIIVGLFIITLLVFVFRGLFIAHEKASVSNIGREADVAVWLDDVINNIDTGDKDSDSYNFIESIRSFSEDSVIDESEYLILRTRYNALKDAEGMKDIQKSLTKIDARRY